MDFLNGVLQNTIATLFAGFLIAAMVTRSVVRVAFWPALAMATVKRRCTIRFSASALLRVQRGDEYLLVKTPARGSSVAYWGPLGGVIKFRPSARTVLTRLEAETDWHKSLLDDMENDLRIKMKGACFWRFIRWYQTGQSRESPSETLSRELREELVELHLGSLASNVEKLEICVEDVRGTGLFKQEGLWHCRLFYVCEISGPCAPYFETNLISGINQGNLEFISRSEIERGAHEGIAVGGHSAYLVPTLKYENRNVPAYQ